MTIKKYYRAVNKNSPGREGSDNINNNKSSNLLSGNDLVNDVVIAPVVSSRTATKDMQPHHQEKDNENQVVFESPASYHLWTWILISIAPVATLLSMVIVKHDHTFPPQMKADVLFCLLWTTIALILLFISILPRLYRVYSNGTISVKTCIFTFRFSNATGAADDPPFEDWSKVLKFSTNFTKRVIVRRSGGWDILVSPKDTKGFVEAVWKVAVDEEEGAITSGGVLSIA